MTKLATTWAITAVLAIYAPAGADIQSRNLELETQVKLELTDGRKVDCKVVRWDGFGFEGSCGTCSWSQMKPAIAFATLRALVSERDAEACADAATVVISLEENGIAAKPALDWARKAGASSERLDRIRSDAAELRKSRAARMRDEREQRLARLTPEAGAFSGKPWPSLHSQDVDAVSASTIEAARALLAKTGGSATLHETQHIALLVESGDEAFVKDAAAYERYFRELRDDFEEISIAVAEQGTIPVVIVSDSDRWRLLVQAAFGGDAAQHPDAVTIYPKTGDPAEQRPIVLVHPESDPARQRYNACTGIARAVMHLAGSPARCPAWLNESLPKILGDQAVPSANMDADFRKRALAAVRAGASFGPVLLANYGEGIWSQDPALAHSMSYLFARWLNEQAPARLLRYARGPRTSEGEPARFKRIFGMSMEDAAARASAWFQTND